MYNYQKNNRFFAQAADDILDLAEEEILELGGSDIAKAYRGVYFNADKESLYRINYNSRLLNRVLAPIISFDCHSDNYLYKISREIEWSNFIKPEDTFAVFAAVNSSKINHSKFAALRIKDSIVDYFKDKFHKRPNVDTINPDVWVNLHLENNFAVISIDTSGGSLHRRGYRKFSVEAPMIETLAASIVQIANIKDNDLIIDPFCGSGTIPLESYIKLSKTPASFLRNRFGFEKLPDFDIKVWNKIKKESDDRIINIKNPISGSDISIQSVVAAKENIKAFSTNQIEINQKDIFLYSTLENKKIICNPPYGVRIKSSSLPLFYKELGDFLKHKCKGTQAFIYFGERENLKHIGLKPKFKRPLQNGGLDGRLAMFEIY